MTKGNGVEQVRLEIFSDYVCPFCWLAEPAVHRLEQRNPQVETVWRAFELRPEPAPTLDPNGQYLKQVWRDSVYPLAEALGRPLRLPPVQPRSRRAHEAAQWAREVGRFDDYHAALFRAFFERGQDIGDIAVLTALARELKLDGDALREALEGRRHEGRVLADERKAQTLGIGGVPAFVSGKRILTGLQSPKNLEQLVAGDGAAASGWHAAPDREQKEGSHGKNH